MEQQENRTVRLRKAEYRAATFRLPPDVLDRLDAYAFDQGMVKGEVVARALREYLGMARDDSADKLASSGEA